jgi:hypothetical protein
VRISCAHQPTSGTGCKHGRLEVKNIEGTWGTVCGHWTWDNDNAADIVCRQLGYASGEVYTFGHSTQLPSLPVVTGGRVCTGTEANIFGCPLSWNDMADSDCMNGCLGTDGLQGTLDDTVDHAVSSQSILQLSH